MWYGGPNNIIPVRSYQVWLAFESRQSLMTPQVIPGTFVPLVRLYHTRTPRSSTTPPQSKQTTNQRHQPTNTAPGPFTTPLPSLLCCSWCIYLPLRLLRVSRLLLGVCRCYTSVTRSLLVLASCWCLFSHLSLPERSSDWSWVSLVAFLVL